MIVVNLLSALLELSIPWHFRKRDLNIRSGTRVRRSDNNPKDKMRTSITPDSGTTFSLRELPKWLGMSAAMMMLAACGTLPVDSTLVTVEGGVIQGVWADGVLAYKGIPYAAPPVSDLRWRSTRPAILRLHGSVSGTSPAILCVRYR